MGCYVNVNCKFFDKDNLRCNNEKLKIKFLFFRIKRICYIIHEHNCEFIKPYKRPAPPKGQCVKSIKDSREFIEIIKFLEKYDGISDNDKNFAKKLLSKEDIGEYWRSLNTKDLYEQVSRLNKIMGSIKNE